MPRIDFQERSGRETRLLILVVVVSVALLLVLARFRYPAANLTAVAPPAGPLAGLAARAAFEDMAATLNSVLTRIAPQTFVVELEPEPPQETAARGATRATGRRTARGAAEPAESPAPEAQRLLVAAVRMQPDLALVPVPAGWRIVTPPSAVWSVVGHDPERNLSAIRTPVTDTAATWPGGSYVGFGYVGVVDVTAGGPTIQPLFIGRVDPLPAAGWSRPLIDVGRASPVDAGRWLFAMDGSLIGLTTAIDGGVAVVPPNALLDAARAVPPRSSP
jgi:hypothetical protein